MSSRFIDVADHKPSRVCILVPGNGGDSNKDFRLRLQTAEHRPQAVKNCRKNKGKATDSQSPSGVRQPVKMSWKAFAWGEATRSLDV